MNEKKVKEVSKTCGFFLLFCYNRKLRIRVKFLGQGTWWDIFILLFFRSKMFIDNQKRKCSSGQENLMIEWERSTAGGTFLC